MIEKELRGARRSVETRRDSLYSKKGGAGEDRHVFTGEQRHNSLTSAELAAAVNWEFLGEMLVAALRENGLSPLVYSSLP